MPKILGGKSYQLDSTPYARPRHVRDLINNGDNPCTAFPPLGEVFDARERMGADRILLGFQPRRNTVNFLLCFEPTLRPMTITAISPPLTIDTYSASSTRSRTSRVDEQERGYEADEELSAALLGVWGDEQEERGSLKVPTGEGARMLRWLVLAVFPNTPPSTTPSPA